MKSLALWDWCGWMGMHEPHWLQQLRNPLDAAHDAPLLAPCAPLQAMAVACTAVACMAAAACMGEGACTALVKWGRGTPMTRMGRRSRRLPGRPCCMPSQVRVGSSSRMDGCRLAGQLFGDGQRVIEKRQQT